MKHILIISLLFTFTNGFSQKYLEKITEETCTCIEKIIQDKTIAPNDIHEKMGLCMISAVAPYQKQLKKDFNFDIGNSSSSNFEQLGKMIGMQMVGKCPNTLMAVTKLANTEEKEEVKVEGKRSAFTATKKSIGTVTKIENNLFLTFFVKNKNGKTSKFYWMNFVDSELDLTNTKALIGKSIDITYKTEEFYDPNIQEYRSFNVITKIK